MSSERAVFLDSVVFKGPRLCLSNRIKMSKCQYTCSNFDMYAQIQKQMSKYQYLSPLAIYVSTVCKNIYPNRCMDLVLYCLVLMYFSTYIYRGCSVDIYFGVSSYANELTRIPRKTKARLYQSKTWRLIGF